MFSTFHDSMAFGTLWSLVVALYVLTAGVCMYTWQSLWATKNQHAYFLGLGNWDKAVYLLANSLIGATLAVLPYINLVALLLTLGSIALGWFRDRQARRVQKAYLDRVLQAAVQRG